MKNEPERLTPNAGAPSERAGKVREIVERWIEANRYREVGLPTYAESGDALARALDQLLDAECKAAVASLDAKLERRNKQLLVADNALRECEEHEKAAVAAAIEQAASIEFTSEQGIKFPMPDWCVAAVRSLSPDPEYVKKQVAAALIPPEAKIRGLESNATEAEEIQAELEAVIDRLLSHSPMIAITGHKKLYTWIYCSCGFNKDYATHTTAPSAWAKHISDGAAGYIALREAEAVASAEGALLKRFYEFLPPELLESAAKEFGQYSAGGYIALREAEARIAGAEAIFKISWGASLKWQSVAEDNLGYVAQCSLSANHIAALTEERDRIAKETK